MLLSRKAREAVEESIVDKKRPNEEVVEIQESK
jgi:hypothetical protein